MSGEDLDWQAAIANRGGDRWPERHTVEVHPGRHVDELDPEDRPVAGQVDHSQIAEVLRARNVLVGESDVQGIGVLIVGYIGNAYRSSLSRAVYQSQRTWLTLNKRRGWYHHQ